MGLSLIQYRDAAGQRFVAALDGEGRARCVTSAASAYELASDAILRGATLDQVIQHRGWAEEIDLTQLLEGERLLAPIDHPEPARLYLTGTADRTAARRHPRHFAHPAQRRSDLGENISLWRSEYDALDP